MSTSKTKILALITMLVGSNLWWAYRTLDNGITLTYTEDSLEQTARGFNQAIAIIPLVAQQASQREIVSAAKTASELDIEPFEKEGYLWVGELGLKFDTAGKFVGVVTQ